MEKRKPTLNRKRARALADRTQPIVTRHASIPAVNTVGAMVVPLATVYIATHDALGAKETLAQDALLVGRRSVAEVFAAERMWRANLVRDLGGFDGSGMDATVEEPDSVFADTQRLLTIVREREGEVPYASDLVNELVPLLEKAVPDWRLAQQELAELQALQRVLRAHGLAFLSGLVRLRRVLRKHLGRDHRDYKALRAIPKRGEEDVTDLDVTTEPATVATQPVAPSNGASVTPSGTTA